LIVTREQVLAFRVARHRLHERLPAGSDAAAAEVGLQDTPPGSAILSLAARVEEPDLDALVIVPSLRGAPLAVAPADLPVFTAGVDPPDEAAARAFVGSAVRTLGDMPALEALDRVSEAVADSLAGGALDRDAFHQALRERLPDRLLPWCRGCRSHHVHPLLWRATGVRGVLAIVSRDGRTAVFGRPPEAPPAADPGAELARRFLRAYGPARPPVFAEWAGIAPHHARALWERAGALESVEVDGRERWLLAEDRAALEDPPRATGLRLLPGYDPYTAQRDRETLVPDPAQRKRVWRPIGNPGAVLVDGELAGLWRAARKGRRLVLTVEWLAERRADLEAEARVIAGLRGCDYVEIA
jgi:DNA glycosylase AlkZ-like